MQFNQEIKKKADDLICKAKAVPNIEIKWAKPIIIKCGILNTLADLKSTGILENFALHKKQPAIYYFEIKGNHFRKEIINALLTFKGKKERSCPKIDEKREFDPKYLYCGSRKEGLQRRLIEHLGFGHGKTFALQLLFWARDLQLELAFHYAWLDPEYKNFTELLESALADKLKPLVGKIA